MSYLIQYAVGRAPAVTRARGTRVDERTLLNLPEFDGGAYVRALVEDTTTRRNRRRRLATPRLKLRIADCVNEVNLEFSVESGAVRENSLHKIDTLIAVLERFRTGLVAEAELRVVRERGSQRPTKGGARCRT